MTKQINKTIRSLKEILGELEAIDANIVFDGNRGVYDLGMAQHHIREMIATTEEKYQKLHRIGAHDE